MISDLGSKRLCFTAKPFVWAASLGVRIPPRVTKMLDIEPGDMVNVFIENSGIKAHTGADGKYLTKLKERQIIARVKQEQQLKEMEEKYGKTKKDNEITTSSG